MHIGNKNIHIFLKLMIVGGAGQERFLITIWQRL